MNVLKKLKTNGSFLLKQVEKSMANSCVKVLFPFSYMWFGKQASEA